MELTEEDFIAAVASREAFAEAVTSKPQGWYSLFYREKDQLLSRIRQSRSSEPQTSTRGSSGQVNALAAEYARVEKINDLIAQTTALRDTIPKAHQMFGNNKAQRVLGGEAPRQTHAKSMSWQDQQRAYRTRRDSPEDEDSSEDERERDRLANELAEGRRVVQENLRRLIDSETNSETRSSTNRPPSQTVESSPKSVTFDIPGSRSSGLSHASGGSHASETSHTTTSSHTSESDHSSKAMKMLGIGRKSSVQNDTSRVVENEKHKRMTRHELDTMKIAF